MAERRGACTGSDGHIAKSVEEHPLANTINVKIAVQNVEALHYVYMVIFVRDAKIVLLSGNVKAAIGSSSTKKTKTVIDYVQHVTRMQTNRKRKGV